MFNFFKKEKDNQNKDISSLSIASLLIHAAKIDENYTEKEKRIIKNTLIELGVNKNSVDDIIKDAEIAEKTNQILEYTKEQKISMNKK